MNAPGGGPARVARAIAIAPIVVYQRVISPAIPRRCKYEPTCSRYAVDAIGRYGILKGLVLAGWRLLRCNPWSYGGYDPVEAQQLFAHRPAGRAEQPAGAQPAGASTKRSSPEHSHSMTAETT
jgi:putative membrane protein insertion efficiency factor